MDAPEQNLNKKREGQQCPSLTALYCVVIYLLNLTGGLCICRIFRRRFLSGRIGGLRAFPYPILCPGIFPDCRVRHRHNRQRHRQRSNMSRNILPSTSPLCHHSNAPCKMCQYRTEQQTGGNGPTHSASTLGTSSSTPQYKFGYWLVI